jgi:hypothetical protein
MIPHRKIHSTGHQLGNCNDPNSNTYSSTFNCDISLTVLSFSSNADSSFSILLVGFESISSTLGSDRETEGVANHVTSGYQLRIRGGGHEATHGILRFHLPIPACSLIITKDDALAPS